MCIAMFPVTTLAAAEITIQPVDVVRATGSGANFQVTAALATGSTGTITYQWQYQQFPGGAWANVSGGSNATTRSYTTANVTVAMGGYVYRCNVTNGGTTVYSNSANLFVQQNITSAFTNIGINLGGTTLRGLRNYAYNVTAANAGDYYLALNCGGNNMREGTNITLTIDGTPTVIALNDIPVGTSTDRRNIYIPVNFAAGVHTISIDATLVPGEGGLEALQIDSLTPIGYMTVPNPTFSRPGDIYNRFQKQEFSVANPEVWKDVKFRYTIDGSTPSETVGTLYEGAFNIFGANATLDDQVTIKAIAYQEGKNTSQVVTHVFTVGPDNSGLRTLTCNRDSAQLTSSNCSGITITSPDGGSIYYTLDGSDPTPTSPTAKKYVAALKILQAATLKAVAFDSDGYSSPLLERTFTLLSPTPTFQHFPASGDTVGKGSSIGITNAINASKAVKFWYTTDGTDPNPDNVGDGHTYLYTGLIEVPWDLEHGATFQVKAIAAGEGLITSAIGTSTAYTFDANTPRLTEIKKDPDFIKWKEEGFKNGEEPQSLIDLIDKIFDQVPRNTTSGVGLYNVFGGSGGQQIGVPGSAWRSTGITAYGIPELHSYDGPAGVRLTAESGAAYERDVTYWPNSTARSSAWNKELSEKMGEGWGKELNYYSLNVILAPGLNIHRSVLNGRNFEYYSEDPMLAGLTAASEINGIQKDGQAGVSAKHFAMNQQETNRTNGDTIASTRAIREIYLRAFQYVQENSDPWTYMTSFNEINGIHASQNYDLITTILRNEWGYKGTVMTDYNGYGTAGANGNLWPYYEPYSGTNNLPSTTHPGLLKGGNELALATGNAGNVKTAHDNGYLTDDDLRREFRRLMVYTSKHNIFNDTTWHYNSDEELKSENAQVAEQLAEEAAVLLKNNKVGSTPALPLKETSQGKVLSLGMSADRLYRGGTGSGSINMTAQAAGRLTQIPEALANKIGANKVINTATMSGTPGISQVASITASGAMSSTGARNDLNISDARFAEFYNEDLSAVLFVIQRESGENADIRVQKGAYYTSEAEDRLINQGSTLARAKNIPFIVIFNTGSWVEIDSWKDKADAIIQCWNTGQSAATPMVKLLYGEANPSGKLPTTVPVDVVGKDANGNKLNPSEGYFALSNAQGGSTYREGIFVGYRYYDTFGVPVSYPFGYGLSYTTFDLSNATLSKDTFTSKDDKLTASITITNTGDRAGKEVAQFYIAAPGVSMVKPVKELKGYGKTKELANGQSDTITVEFDAMSLASYDEYRGMWVVEPGEYKVYYANSSAADGIKATKTFTVDKEIVAAEVHKEALAPENPINEYMPGEISLTVKTTRTRAENKAIDTVFAVTSNKNGNIGDDATLIVAQYDKDNVLIGNLQKDFTITAATEEATSTNFTDLSVTLNAGTAKVKAYLWAKGELKPLNRGAFYDIR